MELKRQDGAEFNSGETLHGLSKRRDICRNLIRVWIAKADAGENVAELLATYGVRIAARPHPLLERIFKFMKYNDFWVGQQGFEPRTH